MLLGPPEDSQMSNVSDDSLNLLAVSAQCSCLAQYHISFPEGSPHQTTRESV
jgi:hypothetical protein